MLNAAREYQRPSDKGARGKEQEVETERKERQGEGGRERELVRIFPRVLTAPAREKRATINAILCGSAALTRRPNTARPPSIVSANNETMDSGRAILMVGLYAP